MQPSVVELLVQLVRCPSITSDTAVTRVALTTLADYLVEAGVAVTVSESAAGVPTLLARIDGDRPGANILFQGHIDVVPVDVGWQRDPFGAVIDDGYLYGRGACDMKAGLAGFAGALKALKMSGGLDQGSVTLLVDVDEETGSDDGLIPYIAEHGLARYDWAICGEPTSLHPYLGNRGLLWVRVTVDGVASHAGIPSAGLNPVPVAAEIVGYLSDPDRKTPSRDTDSSPLTVTTFQAGTVVNSIADKAVFTIDRRLVPGESAAGALKSITEDIAEIAAKHPRFPVSTEVIKSWPPCLIGEGSALARAAHEVSESVLGAASFGFDQACNDASFLSEAGVPTIIWGPGDPALAHTSEEKVSLADLASATQSYGLVIEKLKSVQNGRT
ncbi:MAG: M20/M25/M40 family metallo-hydrolase [Mycobacterium sp.]